MDGGCQLHQILLPLLVFLSAGIQGNSHPVGSSKADGLDEGRHVVAYDFKQLDQYVAMNRALMREFCLVDWALLPLSTKG